MAVMVAFGRCMYVKRDVMRTSIHFHDPDTLACILSTY